LGNSYDPIHFDIVAMMPFALTVMDVNPELWEILMYTSQDTDTSYTIRVQAEISKCQ